jgi:ABC-2 type transport system permease protein
VIGVIAWRELRNLFLSPLAWVLLAVVQFVLAWLFLVQLEAYLAVQDRLGTLDNAPGVTDLVVAPLFGSAALILLFILPLLTMRVFSEEFRSGSFRLLLSAPVSMTQITLGKYLGLAAFLGIAVVLVGLAPLSLTLFVALDSGKVLAGILGLTLLLASLAAIGLFLSSLTEKPAVAAVGTYGVLLFLWIINLAGAGTDRESALFTWLSLMHHYQNMLQGLVRSSDLVYFLLLITTALVLTVRRLDVRRTGN